MSTPISRAPYAYLADNLLELVELTNERTGKLTSTATVQCVVTDDRTGAQVGGVSWPLAMPPVAGSPGRYNCTLPVELAVTLKGPYTATITADAGVGLRGRWLVRFIVQDLVLVPV